MGNTTSQKNNNRDNESKDGTTEERKKTQREENTHTMKEILVRGARNNQTNQKTDLSTEDMNKRQKRQGMDKHTHTYHKYHGSQEEEWKIGTTNVRGLKDGIKPQQLMDHMITQKMQILGVAETNFTEDEHRYKITDHSEYRLYWVNGEGRGEGVGIILNREIDRHCVKVKRYGGRIITTELLFKDRVRLGIAQIYFPGEKTKRVEWEKKLRRIIQGWENNNTHMIVMGDFNAVVDPRKDRKGGTSPKTESGIFGDMRESNQQDNFRVYNRRQEQYTWEERSLGSRIDMIWTSEEITEAT
jgi:exonuclease III